MFGRRGLFKQFSVVDVAFLLLLIDGAVLILGAINVFPDLDEVSKLTVVGLPAKAIILKAAPARSRLLMSGKSGNIHSCQGYFSTTNGQKVSFSLGSSEVYFSTGIDCDKGGTTSVIYDPQNSGDFRFGTRTSILTQFLQSVAVFSVSIVVFIVLLLIFRFAPFVPPGAPTPTRVRHHSHKRRRGAKRLISSS